MHLEASSYADISISGWHLNIKEKALKCFKVCCEDKGMHEGNRSNAEMHYRKTTI